MYGKNIIYKVDVNGNAVDNKSWTGDFDSASSKEDLWLRVYDDKGSVSLSRDDIVYFGGADNGTMDGFYKIYESLLAPGMYHVKKYELDK